MSRAANEVQSGLIADLQGYGRNNRAGLSAIATYGAWPELAARETEQRMARFLESLPPDELQAIAQLEINLNELASQVLAANLDLQLAANRVQQSRAARGVTAADRLPSVSATASGLRARNSEVGLNDPSGNGGREDYGLFQAGIGLSWELDLWGRVRRQVEAADARVQMAEEDAHAVRIALLAETARDYLQLRATRHA
ncbi:hypothetical protein G6F40_014670 [Rhizopus arrhizus]|nr:hypothetical protein G6F40_014670 [Rhizopus arrhizus]